MESLAGQPHQNFHVKASDRRQALITPNKPCAIRGKRQKVKITPSTPRQKRDMFNAPCIARGNMGQNLV